MAGIISLHVSNILILFFSSCLVSSPVYDTPVFPLIFHSIRDEIPEAHRQLITRLYQLWLVLLGTLLINMIACICILVSGSASGGSGLGASIG